MRTRTTTKCVRMAAAEAAATHHGVIVQDTAWEGYEEIPTWIMQGYGTMASEAAEQMRQIGVNRPTHVFIQAGVGSLAGAVVGFFTNLFPNDPPKFIVMEARAQPTVSMRVLWPATATLVSSRVISKPSWPVLPAASPNIISWDILRETTSPPSSPAPTGSAPGACGCWACRWKGDPTVISGESRRRWHGSYCRVNGDRRIQGSSGLPGSRPVQPGAALSPPKATPDPMKFRKVLWDGEYPTV